MKVLPGLYGHWFGDSDEDWSKRPSKVCASEDEGIKGTGEPNLKDCVS